jgi:hypothetical protein
MVAEVVHGAPCWFSDPARFSLAHGGKDRHSFPVPLNVCDETIAVIKSAVQKAKLRREEELEALERLDDQTRNAEATAKGASFDSIVDRVRPAFNGRPAICIVSERDNSAWEHLPHS